MFSKRRPGDVDVERLLCARGAPSKDSARKGVVSRPRLQKVAGPSTVIGEGSTCILYDDRGRRTRGAPP